MVAIFSALAGTAKETAVVIPVITILVDRAVIAGSWRGCLRHWPWHAAAAASWPVVLVMLSALGGRGTSAGFVSLSSSWHYLLTQSWAIWVYLLRIVWPATLVFDYGNSVSTGIADSWPWLVATALLFVGICVGFARRPTMFLGPLLFFVLLAPTSSVIPVKTQTVAEHRLYLPLAAAVAAAATFAGDALRRLQAPRWVAALLVMAAASVLGGRTVARNLEFRSPELLWRQSLAMMPDNSRAMNNLSVLLIAQPTNAGLSEAEALLAQIAAREPDRQDMLINRATLRKKQGRFDDAIADLSHYIRLNSTHARAYADRGYLHWKSGSLPAAIADLERALAIDPETISAWTNLGNALIDAGRPADGERCFERARDIDPQNAVAWWHCGVARATRGDTTAALHAFDTAVALDPGDADARFNRGNLLAMMRRPMDAIADFDAVVRLDPSRGEAWLKRARLAIEGGDLERARADLARYASLGGQIPPDLARAVGLGN
jgi:tetratricopeptide (TPR) repeat protein